MPTNFNAIFKNAKIFKIGPLEPKLWKKRPFPVREMDLLSVISRTGNGFTVCHFPYGKWYTINPFPVREMDLLSVISRTGNGIP